MLSRPAFRAHDAFSLEITGRDNAARRRIVSIALRDIGHTTRGSRNSGMILSKVGIWITPIRPLITRSQNKLHRRSCFLSGQDGADYDVKTDNIQRVQDEMGRQS
jgi:hypothetical protein